MSKFHIHRQKPVTSKRKIFMRFVVLLFLIILSFIGGSIYWYNDSLKPLSDDTTEIVVTVDVGATAPEIGKLLEQKKVIKSALVFDIYTRLENARSGLKAGSYTVSPSQDIKTIVEKLQKGDVTSDLITILPAQRLDQIKASFIAAGYTIEEVNEALNPELYKDHPVLAGLPQGATLEGYLYPETYARTVGSDLSEIITSALDEFNRQMTNDLIQKYEQYNLSLHEAVILSSIIEREVSDQTDRAMVAQVFLTRYQIGMMLGSDPTALYGALIAGIEPSVFADTPYNTRIYTGLPPGPINNVRVESLQALAEPTDTDYLYFVSGDDGKTYFSRTLEEHEALTAQHCIELCRSY